MVRSLLILFCLVSAQVLHSQVGELPKNLTSTRSIVLVSVPNSTLSSKPIRGDWKKVALQTHKGFRKIGIDGIYYLGEEDFHSGAEITATITSLLSARRVQNVLYVTETGVGYDKTYTLKICTFDPNFFYKNAPGYEITAPSLDELLIRLGRLVLREQLERTNFLIADQPEFLEDFPFFNGSRYENYPSRLKSVKLAVVRFSPIAANPDWDELTRNEIAEHNLLIEEKNQRLAEIMKTYPYPHELVDYASIENLNRAGYQYVLFPLQNSGRNIRQLLDYKLKAGETNYVSAVSTSSGVQLETYPSASILVKYYLRQTMVGDIHVGSRWDAAPSWEEALRNFIQNLSSELR